MYEGVSKHFWAGRLERELQIIQLTLGAVYWYFVCQSSEFCGHNALCCFSSSVCCVVVVVVVVVVIVYFVIASVQKLLDIPSYICYSPLVFNAVTTTNS